MHKNNCLLPPEAEPSPPPFPVEQVWQQMKQSEHEQEWENVVRWEGREEELMVRYSSDDARDDILTTFIQAHSHLAEPDTGSHHHLSVVALEKRRIALLAKRERFRDQGEARA